MSRYDRYEKFVEYKGQEEMSGGGRRPTGMYETYQCIHCPRVFAIRAEDDMDIMLREVKRHIDKHYPEEVEREPYPNEEIFREWAETAGHNVAEPRNLGDALIAQCGKGQVILNSEGTIVLDVRRVIGGGEDDHDVQLQGDQLVVDGEDGRVYVSREVFPVGQ